MTLDEIYQDKSIREYAYSLAGDVYEAEELVSVAYEICITKSIDITKQYFARVMRNQQYKKGQKKDIRLSYNESVDVESVLERMYPYYANILKSIYNGDKLTTIHKQAKISYTTLREDYAKAKKEFKVLYKKTKIAIIATSNSGVAYHRLNAPFSKLSNEYKIEISVYWNTDDTFINKLDDDVTHVIYSRNISVLMQPEQIITKLRSKGIEVICDVDDYWVLPKVHKLYNYYKRSNYSECLVRNMQMASQVWTTTPQLADEIKKYNKKVSVVKNAIWKDDPQFSTEDISIGYDKYFYSGGNSHFRDLLLLGKVFNKEDLTIKAPMNIKKLNATYIPVSDVYNYAKDYYHCGVCLVPLVENKFNSLKSELKMIEAGHFSKPVIVSNVYPYRNIITTRNCIAVNDNDWSKALNRIKGSHKLQEDIGNRLKEDVETHYNLDKENRNRLQLL